MCYDQNLANEDGSASGRSALSYKVRDELGPEHSIKVHRTQELAAPPEPHHLTAHRLLLVRKGSATIGIDSERYDCPAGTLLYTRPGQVQHMPVTPEGDVEWADAIQICFTGSSPTRFAIRVPSVIDDAFGTRKWQLGGGMLTACDQSFAEIADEYDKSAGDATGVTCELVRMLLAGLLLRITRMATEKQTDVVVLCSQTYHLFRRELEESFTRLHTTNEYANVLGYSARTLNRACIKDSGHTAKELIDTRIALEAKRLLTYTNLPVSTIARKLGFSEATNFSKHFHRMTECQPGAFRRAHQGLW